MSEPSNHGATTHSCTWRRQHAKRRNIQPRLLLFIYSFGCVLYFSFIVIVIIIITFIIMIIRKEGNVLFNDALNTFYLRLYSIGHMVKDHSDSERGNPLLPQGS